MKRNGICIIDQRPSFTKIILSMMISISLLVVTLTFVVQEKDQIFFAPPITTPNLINEIDTSIWSPPSPDPTGITYYQETNTLLITDSEVEKIPVYAGKKVFEATLQGELQDAYNVLGFTHTPMG